MPYIQAVPRAIAVPSRQLRKPRDAANIQVDQWRAVERRGPPLALVRYDLLEVMYKLVDRLDFLPCP